MESVIDINVNLETENYDPEQFGYDHPVAAVRVRAILRTDFLGHFPPVVVRTPSDCDLRQVMPPFSVRHWPGLGVSCQFGQGQI